MDKKPFIDKIINALKMSLNTDFSDFQGTCDAYDPDDFDNYWEDLLTKEKAREMESHCLDCPVCIQIMAKTWDTHEKARNISQKMNYDAFNNLTANLMERYSFPKNRITLWAAASDRTGGQGEALGVAVAEDDKEGTLIECNAWVGTKENQSGKLQIWGMQVEGTDSGAPITRPLDYLEEKLDGIFEVNPLLRRFQLNRRYTSVDLKERIFKEANSLSLAIIMSIVNAALQRKENPPIVYSADIRQDGKLERVGQIRQKLEAVRKFEIKEVVLSRENEPDCPPEFLTMLDFKVNFFDNLLDLFEYYKPLSSDEPTIDESYTDITECFPDPELEPQIKPKTEQLTSPVKEWDFLIEKIAELGTDRALMEGLFPFFEDLCQSRNVKRQFSTVFFMGVPEKIHTVLPLSGFELLKKHHLLETSENLQALAALVNGSEMGFVIDSNGRIDSICKVNIEIVGRPNVSPLLMGANHRYSCLSLFTESLVFFFPPTGRHLHVFAKGKLIGKYLNGRWRKTNYDLMEELLRKTCESEDLTWSAIKKSVRSAVAMAEKSQGGTFFFIKDTEKHSNKWEDRLKAYMGLQLKPLPMEQIAEEELMNLAKEEGAVIIDRRGRIITCCGFFLTRIQERLGLSTRNQYACKFSEMTGGLGIVASRYNGTVTLFSKGKSLIYI
ncbi:hypothetical protein C6A36_00655 [Desulfobacteraceae bacterium SEEP-SAG10]|nr:hypothetical protein C6A36_00655 [Desulfobacteraceae bacterium SEEP-SAG10]